MSVSQRVNRKRKGRGQRAPLEVKRLSGRFEQRLDFGEAWHRWRGTRAGDRDTGDRTSRSGRPRRALRPGNRRGEAAVESITRPGRLDHRPRLEGGNEYTIGWNGAAPASPSVISAAPTPFAKEYVPGLARLGDSPDRNAGQERRLAFVRRHVVAKPVDRFVDRLGRRRIEDGDDAGFLGDLKPANRGCGRLLELGDENRRPRIASAAASTSAAPIVAAAPGTTMIALSPVLSLT